MSLTSIRDMTVDFVTGVVLTLAELLHRMRDGE